MTEPRTYGTAGWHRPMLVFAGVMVVAAVGSAVGLAVDRRELLGAPIWIKPLKFALSMALYGVVWSWLYALLARGRRLASALTNLSIAALAVEYAVIVVQVVRGRPSHFDVATPLDTTLWVIMGTSIVVLWLATLVLTGQVIAAPVADPAERAAVRLGTVIALVGMALGFLMTGPTAAQEGALDAGAPPMAIGAHTVGLPDGGPGLPLVGWSTVGGDLRIPHFVGMHALQLIPLLAIGLALAGRRWSRLADASVRARLVTVGAAGYAGLVALVTWQAERGQSVVRPDGWTLGGLAVLVGAVLAAALLALARPGPGATGTAAGPGGSGAVAA